MKKLYVLLSVIIVLLVANLVVTVYKIKMNKNEASKIYAFKELDRAPEVIKTVKPEYPEKLKREEIEGSVFVEVSLDENGVPIMVKVIKSSGYPEMDSAATKAAKEMRFTPALKDGKAVRTKIIVPMRFTLHKGKKE